MEITCDNEYKARNIRGFCHLYDGQEAVATGIQEALDAEDSWVTSYRCHVLSLMRGGSVSGVIGELFGKANGVTKGKGGSMHMYSKENNFFGGHGIVGAQVPVGTGLAFAHKYNSTPGQPMNCAIACYGDGAANQGQIWEAANMANLWDLVSTKRAPTAGRERLEISFRATSSRLVSYVLFPIFFYFCMQIFSSLDLSKWDCFPKIAPVFHATKHDELLR